MKIQGTEQTAIKLSMGSLCNILELVFMSGHNSAISLICMDLLYCMKKTPYNSEHIHALSPSAFPTDIESILLRNNYMSIHQKSEVQADTDMGA